MPTAPLDLSIKPEPQNCSLGSPNSDLNGAFPYLLDSPKSASLSGLSSGVCYQTTAVAQPAVAPLSPISPAWAAQHRSPPWSTNITLQRPAPTKFAALAVVKDRTPARPILSHSAALYLSNNETGYLSPPGQCYRTPNHDYYCAPPKAPESNSSPGSASDGHTGLVSPPRSLIGQPQSRITFQRGGPDLFSLPDSRQASGITASAYSQTPSPGSITNSSGPIYAGSQIRGSRRNSTPTSPHPGTRHQRRSVRPPSQSRRNSSQSTAGDPLTAQQVVDSKKEKIRAYHREVGARNRQKEKEERRRYELQSQWLEKVNADLVAEEKSLAMEKMVLVNELFRHSQCGAHADVEEYLAVQSSKIVQRAKSQFLKT
ncbi:hypothetical protein QBC37DRAFT_167040 [Rhypophila decipiens]|uniref:BZIP domain-containing protein n=1 Tax=Rhypophila decipiens TaxID=261697 RepID=A0AAN7BCL8_9PEZI|nr:hypothetical protein QBC37DRAFT_167040 [Rhypophila decipiens]